MPITHTVTNTHTHTHTHTHSHTHSLTHSHTHDVQEQLESDIAAREEQVQELENLVSQVQLGQEESLASLREHDDHMRQLEREMEEVKGERGRVRKELEAVAGNREETERILTEEVRASHVIVMWLSCDHSWSGERAPWNSCTLTISHCNSSWPTLPRR